VATFLHFEDQTAQLIHLPLNIAQDVVPEFFPFHGNFDLATDILQSVPNLGPFSHDALHLANSLVQVIGRNAGNVGSCLQLFDGSHVNIDQLLESQNGILDLCEPLPATRGRPLYIVLAIEAFDDLGGLLNPASNLLGRIDEGCGGGLRGGDS
jgi:hypothetical protein